MHKLIQILLAVGLITLVILTMAETNYTACLRAINQTERTDRDITTMLEVYGFEPKGNPFFEPTTNEKIRAVFIIKSNKTK